MIRGSNILEIDQINELIKNEDYIVNEHEFNHDVNVYVLNEEIVAFISYSIYFERVELNYIYVKENFRGRHIASKLIESMIKKCEEKGVSSIDLEVSVENSKAIKLYKKYKFEVINIRKKYYHGIDAYLMIKELR